MTNINYLVFEALVQQPNSIDSLEHSKLQQKNKLKSAITLGIQSPKPVVLQNTIKGIKTNLLRRM